VVCLDDATLQPFPPYPNLSLKCAARASLLVLIPKVRLLYICLLTHAPPSGPVAKSQYPTIKTSRRMSALVQLMQGLVATGASYAPRALTYWPISSCLHMLLYYSVSLRLVKGAGTSLDLPSSRLSTTQPSVSGSQNAKETKDKRPSFKSISPSPPPNAGLDPLSTVSICNWLEVWLECGKTTTNTDA
jgi:hypothetical protein